MIIKVKWKERKRKKKNRKKSVSWTLALNDSQNRIKQKPENNNNNSKKKKSNAKKGTGHGKRNGCIFQWSRYPCKNITIELVRIVAYLTHNTNGKTAERKWNERRKWRTEKSFFFFVYIYRKVATC